MKRMSLVFNVAIAEHIDNETRNALNESMLAIVLLETAYRTELEEVRRIWKLCRRFRTLLRAIMERECVLNQQAQNLLVEHGILQWNEKGARF